MLEGQGLEVVKGQTKNLRNRIVPKVFVVGVTGLEPGKNNVFIEIISNKTTF